MADHTTDVTIEACPGGPGFVAALSGRLADPECDPTGFGPTPALAALDLARSLHERGHECVFIAVGAMLRAEAGSPREDGTGPYSGLIRAAELVEGIA